MTIQFIAMRNKSMAQIDQQAIMQNSQGLAHVTLYREASHRKDAPAFTNSLSAIWFIFKSIFFAYPALCNIQFQELSSLNNMPSLLKRWGWEEVLTSSEAMKPGDIIFLKDRLNFESHQSLPYSDKAEIKFDELISHICLAVSSTEVFHCSAKIGQGKIEGISNLIHQYEFQSPPSPLSKHSEACPSSVDNCNHSLFHQDNFSSSSSSPLVRSGGSSESCDEVLSQEERLIGIQNREDFVRSPIFVACIARRSSSASTAASSARSSLYSPSLSSQVTVPDIAREEKAANSQASSNCLVILPITIRALSPPLPPKSLQISATSAFGPMVMKQTNPSKNNLYSIC